MFFSVFAGAQDNWTLEISSSVEIHTLKLTNKAEKKTHPLRGASIKLYQGSAIVKEVKSDARGDFSILVPPDGDFIIEISFFNKIKLHLLFCLLYFYTSLPRSKAVQPPLPSLSKEGRALNKLLHWEVIRLFARDASFGPNT